MSIVVRSNPRLSCDYSVIEHNISNIAGAKLFECVCVTAVHVFVAGHLSYFAIFFRGMIPETHPNTIFDAKYPRSPISHTS